MSFFLEAPPRFELGNKGVADLCLTTWPWRHAYILNIPNSAKAKPEIFIFDKSRDAYLNVSWFSGAEDEIRTRDVHLGKVTLYH